jgi:hypothetical protein
MRCPNSIWDRLPFMNTMTLSNYIACLRIALLAGIAVFFSSCDAGEQDNRAGSNVYYDLKGFVTTQITLLEQETPLVQKMVVSNGSKESLSTKEINWKRELELFLQADINKGPYGKSYTIVQQDSLHYEYNLMEGEKLPVQYLKITLDKPGGTPTAIAAQLVSKNKLYESNKDIQLTCTTQSGRTVISTYSIKGYQRLVLTEPKAFEITGQIKY